MLNSDMKRPFLFVLLVIPLYAISQDTMLPHYKIFDATKQKQVTVDDIINDMAKADVLFFGEEHSDSTAHYLEYTLLKKLAEKYPGKVALSMEMFETDCQTVLNEYLKGFIREKNLIKDARAWPNYTDYRPLIELSRSAHIPVIAANAPSRYTNMVTRMGLNSLQQLDKTGKSFLPALPIDTATGPYYNNFLKETGGHRVMGNMQIYQAQNLWDATMAWSITKTLKNHRGYKVLHLNGGFHSEEKLGAVAQLKKYAPKLAILNIAAFTDDSFDNPDWNTFKQKGDYIILTDPKLSKTF